MLRALRNEQQRQRQRQRSIIRPMYHRLINCHFYAQQYEFWRDLIDTLMPILCARFRVNPRIRLNCGRNYAKFVHSAIFELELQINLDEHQIDHTHQIELFGLLMLRTWVHWLNTLLPVAYHAFDTYKSTVTSIVNEYMIPDLTNIVVNQYLIEPDELTNDDDSENDDGDGDNDDNDDDDHDNDSANYDRDDSVRYSNNTNVESCS